MPHTTDVDRLLERERAAREAAERAMARMARLQGLTASLATASTVAEIADVVVGAGVAALGARAGALALVTPDGTAIETVRAVGYPDAVVERYRRIPLEADFPTSIVARTGEALWLRDASARDARLPALAELRRQNGDGAMATVPVVLPGVERRLLGALGLNWADAQALDEDDRAFVMALAGLAAQALERARLLEAERAARIAAEAAETRLRFLAEASARLAASLDVEDTLRRIAELAVPALADWAIVEMVRADGRIEAVAVHHTDPEKAALGWEMTRRYPIDLAASAGAGRVLRTGEPELVPFLPPEVLVSVAQDAEHLRLIESLGIRSWVSVPLLVRGRVEYALGPVALVEVVADVVPMIEPQAAAKALALDVRLADDAGRATVIADREKLGQVLINLLSNAVKFTPAGGRITVEVATRAEGREPAPPGMTFLRVRDTGPGIAPDKQDTIFEPFVQLQAGHTRTAEGTGLGLAISRDLARGMGGDLRVRSAPGEGAAFTVALRRA